MTDVAAAVREIVAKHAAGGPVDDDTPLGGEGLGLDSISIAEVVIDCEQHFGVEIADLLSGEAVTVRRIAERVGAATAS